ncbi:MAG: UDP-glucose 4-epimerase [Firmicutes bacterium]|nr:UDP-glucose 4-epimerase [candidate division NPL-UPA2 bacterium]
MAFYRVDVTDYRATAEIFAAHTIEGVMHFAGLKAVGESVEQPLAYYYNNVLGTITIAKLCLEYGVNKFVFSSSATVYGDQASPLYEDMALGQTTNPYGETKAMSERILTDITKANPRFAVSLLRYFNPVGAHESGLIGEDPNGIPNNLMPYITCVAKGLLPCLRVFGNDYDTPDGTGVRDYIHVVDLALGHVAAFENLQPGVSIFNLGTGKGTSVLELVHAFTAENGVAVPYEIAPRRVGDVATCFADASRAARDLGWRAKRGIREMVRDAWRFESATKGTKGTTFPFVR